MSNPSHSDTQIPPQPLSPLNPATSAQPITSNRRPPLPHSPGYKSSNSNDYRCTPRSPLAFLSNTPPSTMSSVSSQWSIRTPSSPDTFATPPSNNGFRPGKLLTVKVSSASSLTSPPTPLDRLDHLHALPPSPPINIPSALLLEMAPVKPDLHHSIASPFVNINALPEDKPLGPSPPPPRTARELHAPLLRLRMPAHRRGSSLSQLSITDDPAPDPTTTLSAKLPKSPIT